MLESIDYKKIFTYFEEISNVPRGSYHNEKISEYLVNFAKQHNLEYRVDEALNVIIKKPASADCKNQNPVMIQGHMDMVCVSDDGTHDFENDGLDLQIDGDLLYAKGTTLGGDDGIALAYALAILASDEYTHPPIEAVFTTDEEVGMDGATALDVSDLKAKMMLNIDNEEEGILLVSCAGGASADIRFSKDKVETKGRPITIRVSGLAGGHSGVEIHKHPLNATIFLGRLLEMAEEEGAFRLVSITGGDKDNVITNTSEAQIVSVGDADQLLLALTKYADCMVEEVSSAEPSVKIDIQMGEEQTILSFDDVFTRTIVDFVNLTITAVQVNSSDVPGMVESSLNMGITKTEGNEVQLGFSLRSQKESYLSFMIRKLQRLSQCVSGEGVNSKFNLRGSYPAWDYKKDSVLRNRMVEEFTKLFGREPIVEGIHAGLECGIMSKKIPGLDIVSFGPDIKDIHTAKERLSIESAKRNFDFLVNVLARLAQA